MIVPLLLPIHRIFQRFATDIPLSQFVDVEPAGILFHVPLHLFLLLFEAVISDLGGEFL